MSSKTRVVPDKLVSCKVCMKEIPVSESKSEEATDYVIYYCGLECYEIWLKQQTTERNIVPD